MEEVEQLDINLLPNQPLEINHYARACVASPANILGGNDREAPHCALWTAPLSKAPCCTDTNKSDTSAPLRNWKRKAKTLGAGKTVVNENQSCSKNGNLSKRRTPDELTELALVYEKVLHRLCVAALCRRHFLALKVMCMTTAGDWFRLNEINWQAQEQCSSYFVFWKSSKPIIMKMVVSRKFL